MDCQSKVMLKNFETHVGYALHIGCVEPTGDVSVDALVEVSLHDTAGTLGAVGGVLSLDSTAAAERVEGEAGGDSGSIVEAILERDLRLDGISSGAIIDQREPWVGGDSRCNVEAVMELGNSPSLVPELLEPATKVLDKSTSRSNGPQRSYAGILRPSSGSIGLENAPTRSLSEEVNMKTFELVMSWSETSTE